MRDLHTQGFKANPWLKLANAFGVRVCVYKLVADGNQDEYNSFDCSARRSAFGGKIRAFLKPHKEATSHGSITLTSLDSPDLLYQKPLPILTDKAIRTDMHGYLSKCCAKTMRNLIVNGVEDHIQRYLHYRERIQLRRVVKEIKENIFRLDLLRRFHKLAKFHWQGGYGAFSVSQSNLDEVVRYIENQGTRGNVSGRVPRFSEGVRHCLR